MLHEYHWQDVTPAWHFFLVVPRWFTHFESWPERNKFLRFFSPSLPLRLWVLVTVFHNSSEGFLQLFTSCLSPVGVCPQRFVPLNNSWRPPLIWVWPRLDGPRPPGRRIKGRVPHPSLTCGWWIMQKPQMSYKELSCSRHWSVTPSWCPNRLFVFMFLKD